MSFQTPHLSDVPPSDKMQRVSTAPFSELDNVNNMCVTNNLEQSVHDSSIVEHEKPKELDYSDVEMEVAQTVIVETQGFHSIQSLTSSISMPSDGIGESQLSQDDLNVDLQRERSIADLERERNSADLGARSSDDENDLPLSQKQNQPNQPKSVAQENFGRCASFGDRVCRVCYLGRTAQLENGPAVELGCECKLDLAVAHQQCAEAWFKIKGNRTCEICGTIVHNVNGVGDATFIENWNDGDTRSAEASSAARCWQSHRLFNLLLALMVLAFVLPWIFHISSFIT